MTVQDRLRATTEAVAASMREVRPLQLPPDPDPYPQHQPLRSPSRRMPTPTRRPTHGSRGPGGRGIRTLRRWPGTRSWLIPLTAALAVIAVAAALVSVRNASTPRPAPPAPTPVAPSGAVPGYYAAIKLGPDSDPSLDAYYGLNSVIVGDARTGRLLTAIKPPTGGTFDGVTGAADDRTFVLSIRWLGSKVGAQQATYAWDLLHLAPGTAHPVRLTRLPITDHLDDAVIHGIAVSPDGRTLAVMFMPDMIAGSAPGPITLRTYSVATGKAVRTWTGTRPDGLVCFTCENTVELSWLGSHTLAFSYPESVLPQAIRTLNLTSPGDSLDTDSRAVFPVTIANDDDCDNRILSDGGRTVLCGGMGAVGTGYGCATFGAPFYAYSTATGKLERVLYRYRGSCAFAQSTFLWANGPGTLAIGLVQAYTQSGSVKPNVSGMSESVPNVPEWTDTMTFGVISGGKFTRLSVALRGDFQQNEFGPGLIAF